MRAPRMILARAQPVRRIAVGLICGALLWAAPASSSAQAPAPEGEAAVDEGAPPADKDKPGADPTPAPAQPEEAAPPEAPPGTEEPPPAPTDAEADVPAQPEKPKKKKKKKKKKSDQAAKPEKEQESDRARARRERKEAERTQREAEKAQREVERAQEEQERARKEAERARQEEERARQEAAKEREALQRELEQQRAAGNGYGLLSLCDSRRVARAFTDQEEAQVWQELCHGMAYQLLEDWSRAQASYEAAAARVAALPSSSRHAAREYAALAHFGIGEMYEVRYRSYQLCLARLGDSARARIEAAKRAALQTAAERAFREVLHVGSEEWAIKALYRITAMSDHFYREASGPPVGLRGLRAPPPLASTALLQRPLALSFLGADRSGLRRSIIINYRRLMQRARGNKVDAALIAEIEEKVKALEVYRPPVPSAVVPPWPARAEADGDPERIRRIDDGFEVTLRDGAREKWSTDQAVGKMRALLRGPARGRWAPLAAITLGELGDTGAQPLLLEALAADDDPEIQVAAAHALANVGDADSVTALVDAFRRAQGRAPREVFADPMWAVYGLEERTLWAIAAIGRRLPLAVERLAHEPGLPRLEVAFVLWSASSKSLSSAYSRLREDRDPTIAAYGLMATLALQGESAKWMLQPTPGDSPLLSCVREHLLETSN